MTGLAAIAWFLVGFVTCLALVGFALIREARRGSVEAVATTDPYTTAQGRVEDA